MTRPCVAQPPPSVKRTAALFLVALCLSACDEPPPPSAGLAGERPRFQDPIWNDGNAEVAQYQVMERRYGTMREGHATLIAVTETFDALRLVKADLGTAHPLDVIKLNHVLTTPTGVYTYRQMASVFLDRTTARPLKLATSSQEWCGITSKQMVLRGPAATLHTFSYFGNEGDRAHPVLVDARTVLYDALPLWLRTLDLTRPGARRVQLVPQQMSSHAPAPRVAQATITVGPSDDALRVPAGAFEAVPVTVQHDGGTDIFHFDAEPPHTLVRWDRADGGHYALEWVRRAPYWRMSDDGEVLGPEDASGGAHGTEGDRTEGDGADGRLREGDGEATRRSPTEPGVSPDPGASGAD
ncbi:MAG: hypothetical protein AB8I08_25125 [Sandaracinaceae bacterium]